MNIETQNGGDDGTSENNLDERIESINHEAPERKMVIQQQEKQKKKSQASTRIFEKKQRTRRRNELHSLLNTVL